VQVDKLAISWHKAFTMSTSSGRQRSVTKAFANKEQDDSSQEARNPKRRRDDDADLTSNRSTCVLPSKNRTALDDLQEETVRFDSIRSTESEYWIQTSCFLSLKSHICFV
jgi:hypothetical protein